MENYHSSLPNSVIEPISRRFPLSSGIGSSFSPSTRPVESKIEDAILNSATPLPVNDSEEIEALGHRGIWLNKGEVNNWNGPVPLAQYKINNDPNPEIVHRTTTQPIEYNQDISVRYLRPPTPTGDLIIRQENQHVAVAAPPVVIRQHPPRPITPPTTVIREAPPTFHYDRKVINVTGKTVTDIPDRRLIIERMPSLPPKPPSIIIEKWLPPAKLRRRVVYEGSTARQTYERQRNLVVEWNTPPAIIKRGIKYLGVVNADPNEYRSRYGASLRHPSELPHFVLDYDQVSKLNPDIPVRYTKDLDFDVDRVRTVPESRLVSTGFSTRAATPSQVEVFGDLDALKLLDPATLEREGLQNYKPIYDVNRAPVISGISVNSVTSVF